MSDTARALRRYRLLTRSAIGLIVCGCMAGILLPAGIRWDFAVFYDAGRRALAGEFANLFQPTSLIAGGSPQGTLLFFGAPISSVLYAPFALLRPEWALAVFKAQNVVVYFLGLVLLYRHLRPMAADGEVEAARFAAIYAGMALLFQPFWTVFRVGGQTTPTVFLLLVLALQFHTRQRFVASALLQCLAVMMKPAFAPGLLLLGLISGWRFFASIAGVFSVFGAVSLLLLGWDIHEEFLRIMFMGSMQASVTWPYSSSLYVGFTSVAPMVGGQTASWLATLAMALKVSMVVAAIALLIRSRARKLPTAAQLHFGFLTSIAFFLLTAEVLWEHYLTALFLMLAYVVACRRYFTPGALRLVGAIVVFSMAQNLILVNLVAHNLPFESVLSVVAASLVKSAPVLLTLIFLVRHHQSLFDSYLAPHWQAAGLEKSLPAVAVSQPQPGWALPSNAGS